MTNVGKNKLVKVVFTNIHKISDACATLCVQTVLVDSSWLHNVWEMFLPFIKIWKNGVSDKIKAYLP